MSYTVDLYTNTSDPNQFRKAIAFRSSATCDFKSSMDVENPTVYIAADDSYADVNYLYIPAFKRYYFAKCIGGTSQTLTFECISDPLMSFRAGILSSPTIIARNSYHYDKYLPDGEMPVESRTIRSTFKFPNNHFDGSGNCYVLTTIGSGAE